MIVTEQNLVGIDVRYVHCTLTLSTLGNAHDVPYGTHWVKT